jgi:hypothetical protein
MESTESGVALHQQHTRREDASRELAPEQLYRRDPLLVLLKDKWHVNTLWFLIGSFLLSVGCFFGLYVLSGFPITPKTSLVRGLAVLTLLLFYGVYFYLPNSIANLFNALVDERVIDIDKPLKQQAHSGSYKALLHEFITWINSSLWPLLALLGVLPYLLYRFQLSAVPLPFTAITPPLWFRIEALIIDFSIAYTAILSIVRVSVSLFFLYRLFQAFPVRINPLHSDGTGGLGVLRQILWSSAGIMLGVALAFYEDSIHSSRAVDIALLCAAYAVLIPSLLIGWLILPHLVMLQARKAVLQPLTDEYEKLIGEVEALASHDTAKIKEGTERLSALTERYKLYHDTFPVWPLEVVQMRQLLIAFIFPLLVAFISVIPSIPSMIDYFTKKP